eukprot:s88_g20.t1
MPSPQVLHLVPASKLDHSKGKWFAPGEALPPGFIICQHPEGHTAPQDITRLIKSYEQKIIGLEHQLATEVALRRHYERLARTFPARAPLTTRAVATVHSPYAAEGKSAAPTQLLWALHVEAASQSLLHQWEARCELPATQRVGLLNFSSNGTMVNNQLLCIGGEQVPLKDGDRIALLRERGAGMETLLELLGFGCLAAAFTAGSSTQCASNVGIDPELGDASAMTMMDHALKDPEDEASPRPSAEGVSFLGVRPLPLFSLELGGQGLHDDDLKIIHGPVAPKNEGGPVPGSCLPLLLGRSAQRSFWQRILVSNAFYAMSRQHLQFEVGEEFSVSSSATFHVRNLSSSNPVRICRSGSLMTTLQEEMQAAVPLEMGEKRQLQDRDVIVLNPVQGYSFWLIFSDLWAKRTDAPENGANAADSKWIAFASAKTADCTRPPEPKANKVETSRTEELKICKSQQPFSTFHKSVAAEQHRFPIFFSTLAEAEGLLAWVQLVVVLMSVVTCGRPPQAGQTFSQLPASRARRTLVMSQRLQRRRAA